MDCLPGVAGEEVCVLAVDTLLAAGANHGSVNWCGDTPLHRAISNEHNATVWLRIDRGAEVSAVNHSGSTPLRLALENGRDAVDQLLRDRVPP